MSKYKIYTKCFECGVMEASDLSKFSVRLYKDNEIIARKECKNCGEIIPLFFRDAYREGIQEFISKETFEEWENKRRKNKKA